MDGVLKRFDCERKDLNFRCPRTIRDRIAGELIGDWYLVGRTLDVSVSSLNSIRVDYATLPKPEDKAVAALDAWDAEKGSKATCLKLAEALNYHKKINTLEILCEEVNITLSKSATLSGPNTSAAVSLQPRRNQEAHIVNMAAAPQTVKKAAKDIFISYGREDGVREFAKKFKRDLEANGVSVWLDVDDIPTGSDFHVEIGVALRSCRALIPILTKKYVHSRYCKGELYVANGQNKILLPVIYEDGWEEGEEGAGVHYIVAAYNWAFFRPNQDDHQESINKLISGAKLKLGDTVPKSRVVEAGEVIIDEQDAPGSKRVKSGQITNPDRLFNDLALDISDKYKEIGIELGLEDRVLTNELESGIFMMQTGSKKALKMLQIWRQSVYACNLTYKVLAAALEKHGKGNCADKYCYMH